MKFASHRGFLLQQAYNSANSGPVAEAANEILHEESYNLLLLKHSSQRPAYITCPAVLRTLDETEGVLHSVRLSSDAKRAVSAGNTTVFKVWDVESAKRIAGLKGHGDTVRAVGITPDGKIILAKRIKGIVEGNKWHLPGGRVLAGEYIESALQRHSKRKTGLNISLRSYSLEKDLIGIYDDPKRDSREHVISLAFFCKIIGGKIKPGYNVDKVTRFSQKDLKALSIGFDHEKIIFDSFGALR